MRIRLISLVLLLVFAGSVGAGVPMHSKERSCPMGMMADMDCCKKALSRSNAPQVANARLCCALNCSEDGSAPTSTIQVQLKTQPQVVAIPPIVPASLPTSAFLGRGRNLHGPPKDSNPAYIRHLALLI